MLQIKYAPGWFIPWVRENIEVDQYLSPIQWQACRGGQWRAAPVSLVHEKTYLRYLILGFVPSPDGPALWPEWADQLMDESAKEGIVLSVKALNSVHSPDTTMRSFCYPLTVPNRNIQFKGTSLGLPVSLGFTALLSREKPFGDLAASGSLREDGAIWEVGHLSRKIAHARKTGFKLFLLPANNRIPSQTNDMELLPVSDLGEAWMFAALFTPGKAGELLLLANMLKDPQSFVNNCTSVPLKWLVWAQKNDRTHHVTALIVNSPDLFEAFVLKLGTCLEKGAVVQGESLAKLMGAEPVKTLTDVAPLALFKWFSLNLSMANHRGDVRASEMWEKEANNLIRHASVTDVRALAVFCNHRFIGIAHNRYHFSTQLPDYVKTILKLLGDQFRSECQLVENATNETLGAFYGSIAQNYGFCGPEYLAETKRYSDLSRGAFGGGRVPELKNDWLRQFNYLSCACLDAGDQDAAEKTLLAYLEIERWQELWPKLSGLSQWHHALLCRFLADSEERAEKRIYADWALKNKDRILDRKHPSQLWLYNMGRTFYALGDKGNAVKNYNHSLALCLSSGLGPTVQVMALLPLSGLWKIGVLPGSEMAGIEKKIRGCAQGLNKEYFRPVLDEPDFVRALEKVWTEPGNLFPFTYR